jgi:predicted Zn-dependent protease
MARLLSVLVLVLPALVAAHPTVDARLDDVTHRLAAHPDDPALLLRLGDLERERGDRDAAFAAYERAAAAPNAPDEVELARGTLLAEAGFPRAALVVLDRFVGRHPAHVGARVARARVRAAAGRRVAAAADLSRAIALTPAPPPDLYLERAQLLVAADRPDAALRGLDEGVGRLGPLAALEDAAIDLEVTREQWNAALARVDRLLGDVPRHPAWLLRRGRICERAGRAADARAAFAAALDVLEAADPGRARALDVMAGEARAALARLDAAGGGR